MRDYKLSPRAMVMVAGSSKGTQPKYFDKGFWYKENRAGYEGKTEQLASLVLSCSNVDYFVRYEECTINGKKGCRSQNFLKEGCSFLSFQRLYDMYFGGNLSERIIIMDDPQDRINFIKEFIRDYTGFDCSDYLSKILAFDMLILNTDRHFNNLGIIVDTETEECFEAPVFDNGAGLLSDFTRFPMDNSIDENIKSAYGQPFSSNLEMQAQLAGVTLKIDYDKLEAALRDEPQSRALTVLKYQLDKYKGLLCKS